MAKVIAVSQEYDTQGVLYLFDDGSVWISKHNENKIYEFESPVTAISSGEYHSLILLANGNVYGIGSNWRYQLNLPQREASESPVLIPNIKNIISIACGDDFSLFLHRDGTVWGCGDNEYGQRGLSLQTEIEYDEEYGLDLYPIPKQFGSNVISVTGGMDKSLLILADGRVMIFGDLISLDIDEESSSGYILPDIRDIIQISTHQDYMILLNSKGQVCTNVRRPSVEDHMIKDKVDKFFLLNTPPVKQVATNYDFDVLLFSNGDVMLIGDVIVEITGRNIISINASRDILLVTENGEVINAIPEADIEDQ